VHDRRRPLQVKLKSAAKQANPAKLFNKVLNNLAVAIGLRVEPELEQQLDELAQRMGKSRSACVREAITQYVQRFGQNDEARRQSLLIAEHVDQNAWCDQMPDWSDWTA